MKVSITAAVSLYNKAHAAGLAAGNALTPTPTIVGSPSTPFGTDVDFSQKTYYVPDGMCGFAWIQSKGTEGFVRAIKAAVAAGTTLADGVGPSSREPFSKAYPTGTYIKWVGEYGQSYERKRAYAEAFSAVLRDAGVTSAYSGSRLD